jgi:hypothetical protein
MNCSWIIQLVHELFMNMFKFLLRIFGYFQTLEHLLNMFMNSVQKKKIIWIEDPGDNVKKMTFFLSFLKAQVKRKSSAGFWQRIFLDLEGA